MNLEVFVNLNLYCLGQAVGDVLRQRCRRLSWHFYPISQPRSGMDDFECDVLNSISMIKTQSGGCKLIFFS